MDRQGHSEAHLEVAENSRAVDEETLRREVEETSREVAVAPVVTSLQGEEAVKSLFPEVEVLHHEDEGDLPHVGGETLRQEAVETLHRGAEAISHRGAEAISHQGAEAISHREAAATSHRGAAGISHREAAEILLLVEGAISMLPVEVALLEDLLQLVGHQCVEGLQ